MIKLIRKFTFFNYEVGSEERDYCAFSLIGTTRGKFSKTPDNTSSTFHELFL